MTDSIGDGDLPSIDAYTWSPPVHRQPDFYEGRCKKCEFLVDHSKLKTRGIVFLLLGGVGYGTKYSPGDNLRCSRVENQVRTILGRTIDRKVQDYNSCGLFKVSYFWDPAKLESKTDKS